VPDHILSACCPDVIQLPAAADGGDVNVIMRRRPRISCVAEPETIWQSAKQTTNVKRTPDCIRQPYYSDTSLPECGIIGLWLFQTDTASIGGASSEDVFAQ